MDYNIKFQLGVFISLDGVAASLHSAKDTSHHHPAEPESPRATPAAYTGEYDESVGQTVEDARTIAMLELAAEMRGYAEDLNENARLQSELIDALASLHNISFYRSEPICVRTNGLYEIGSGSQGFVLSEGSRVV